MQGIIIFGPPGVGKGTQAQLISERLKIYHFSTGEILRDAALKGTELGIKAKALMDEGRLVPDEIMIGIVKDALSNNGNSNGFILDGFPRTIEQAKALTLIFDEFGFKDIKILYLTADDDELTRRLMNRGRSDDNIQSILTRLHIYKNTTAPVIDYYKRIKNVIYINGVGEIEEINKKIIEIL